MTTREMWRQVLASSNREMLCEMAKQVSALTVRSSSGEGITAKSLERLALEVADRILEQSTSQLLLQEAVGKTQTGLTCANAEENVDLENEDRSLLDDLRTVPWSIWSGDFDSRPFIPTLSSETPPSIGRRKPRCGEKAPQFQAQDPHRESESEVSGEECPPFVPADSLPRRYSDLTKSRTNSEEQPVVARGSVSGAIHVPTTGATIVRHGLKLLTTTQQHTWMNWHSRPRTVLFVAKKMDIEVTRKLREMVVWADSQGVTVLFEPELLREIRVADEESRSCSYESPSSASPKKQPRSSKSTESTWCWEGSDGSPPLPRGFVERCRTWSPGKDSLGSKVDLVVCIGGDGTLCWTAGLFSGPMPPVIAFAGGSLGFLTPFPMQGWMSALLPLLGRSAEGAAADGENTGPPEPIRLACRMRFRLRVVRRNAAEVASQRKENPEEYTELISHQALNEILVHRGSSGHLCKLEVEVNHHLITMVQGDGLILATPTGSTAYSLAAGGTMVHPSVPGIILTPVCPHSLSFRPVVLPDSAVVMVRVPLSSRNSTVCVAVDGKDSFELNRGDAVVVSVSQHPLPTVCRDSVTNDWFLSVNEALRWNHRVEQKGTGQCTPQTSVRDSGDGLERRFSFELSQQ